MAKSIVISKNGNENDAADVFQDALITMYENINNGKFRGASGLKTYLYAIIRNYWVSRSKKTMKVSGIEPLNDVSDEDPWVPVFDEKEDMSGLLEQVFNGIGEGCRQLLILFYYHRISMKEITQQMSFSNEQSAKVQKYKCMQKLMRLLDENAGLKIRLSELYYKTNQ